MTSPDPSADPLRWLREFRARLARGESLTATQFAAEHQLSTSDELFVDLIFAEFLEREQRGDPLAQDYILSAYPAHAEELRQQILLHRSFQQTGAETIVTPEQADTRTNPENSDSERLPSIPGFEVIRRLGQGGMGAVLLARELQLGRLVAIKLLLSGQLSSRAQRQRFRAEARAAAALRHPSIVQVDDVGEVDGQPFIVMEYVAGGTLEQYLRTHRLSPREAAQLTRQVAWAVHAAHQAGIVHRDLKPGNLLLAPRTDSGPEHTSEEQHGSAESVSEKEKSNSGLLAKFEPKITDFGLAKSLSPGDGEQGVVTVKGDVLGTPSYMSPEQARGDRIGPATDIYSLGSILFELLTGAPPFVRSTPWETVQCVLEQEPPSLSPKLPADLRTICNKCLCKEPTHRYVSMAALAVDLGLYLQGRPITARRVSNFVRVIRWAKRNVVVASLVVTVFLTLVTLLGVALWSRSSLQEMLNKTITAKRQESKALSASREQLWNNFLSEAQAIQTSRRSGQRYRALDNIQEALQLLPFVGDTPERQLRLRNAAIAALPLIDIKPVPLANLPTDGQAFASSDLALQRIALAQPDGSINILATDQRTILHRFPAAAFSSVIISPDGRYTLAQGSECLLQLISDPSTTASLGHGVQWPTFSPDSKWIAGFDQHGLFVYDIQARTTQRIDKIPFPSMPIVFSPPGNETESPDSLNEPTLDDRASHDNVRLAVVSNDRLFVVPIRGETTSNQTLSEADVIELPGPTFAQLGSTLAWHPSGDYLATGLYSDGVVSVWHLPTRSIAREFRVSGRFHNLQFDPSGQLLIVAGLWGGAREIFSFETQIPLLQLPNHAGLAFGKDDSGCPLALADPIYGSLLAWRIENNIATQVLEPAQRSAKRRSHCVVSGCGRWLYVNTELGVEIYDVARGQPAGQLPIGELSYSGVQPKRSGGLSVLKNNQVQHWMVAADVGVHLQRTIPAPPGLSIIDVSEDERWVLCSDNGGVYLFDVTEVEPLRFLGAQSDVRSAAFDLKNDRVATGSWNTTDGVIIWSIVTGREIQRFTGGRQSVVRFSPDGRFLFSSGDGGCLIDLTNGNQWRLDSPDQSGNGFGHAFSSDSRWFVHSAGNGTLNILDLSNCSCVAVLTDADQHGYFSLAFSPDNSSLFGVTVGRECYLKRWDLDLIDRQLTDLSLRPLGLRNSTTTQADLSYSAPLRIQPSALADEMIAQHVLGRVETSFANKNWMAGLAELRSAVQVAPENTLLQTELAWRLVTVPLEFRDATAALPAIRTSLASDNGARCQIVYAFVLAELGQHEEALSIATSVQPLDASNRTQLKFLEARLLAALRRRAEAQEAWKLAQTWEFVHGVASNSLRYGDWENFRQEVGQMVSGVHSRPKRSRIRVDFNWERISEEFVRFGSELRYRWWGK